MTRRALLFLGLAAACAFAFAGGPQSAALYFFPQQPKSGAADLALFHPDPRHIANRLYRALHVRVAKTGSEYGFDGLDPLLYTDTTFLLKGPSHAEALRLLDEFSRARAEKQISDPVKRAILQRDLWAVFDWAAPSPGNEAHRARQEITRRLGPILRRLALAKEELEKLPDPYTQAIEKKEFPAEFDPAHPERPFLPPDFFDPRGPWVCIGVPEDEPVAPMHSTYFSRSVFFVFVRLPGGRDATLAYLNELAKEPLFEPGKEQPGTPNPAVPQFGPGTEFALVRKLILPDDHGNLVLTPVTESVQIRHYKAIAQGYQDMDAPRRSQAAVELRLNRADLFAGSKSGLRAVTPSERDFSPFMAQEDPFQDSWFDSHIGRDFPLPTLLTCTAECHGRPGVLSMMSLSFRDTRKNPQLSETTPAIETGKVISRKRIQDDWKLLAAMWNPDSAP